MIRLLLVSIGIAGITVLSAPYVFAAAADAAQAPTAGELRCRGTIGEARVHCVETLKLWQA